MLSRLLCRLGLHQWLRYKDYVYLRHPYDKVIKKRETSFKICKVCDIKKRKSYVGNFWFDVELSIAEKRNKKIKKILK